MPPAIARPPLDDAAAWQALSPLLKPYLPWSAGAMRPAGLVTVLNDVWFRMPTLVVELGSGTSTVVVARLLHELGTGRLLSIEHDDAWADRVQRQLDREGLVDVADVVRAPLRPHERSWHGAEWYDEAALATAIGVAGHPIDLLVVDGPPAWQPGKEHARYPALGSLVRWLAPGATVVLDDIERAGEQEVLARWQQEHGVIFDMHAASGVAVGSWPSA
ncbi:MAG: class I SAM-dependent methyltransferase [Geodermatophilaceae bacterium]|nr:class I SAM-dependent methyltransferase [Geodermatophilaceae bacterium]MDQ3465117.1 class I SAM-dependent methyltransferase [Actinomycetota bacterium]